MMNHPQIGTGHILLGLLAEGDGVACRALTALGADLDSARAALEKSRPQRNGAVSGHLPFSPRGKKVCELAFREALALGRNYVGTEHVLLGLVREGEGTGASVLVALGISPEDARAKVLELLRGYEKAEQPEPPAQPKARSDEEMRRVWDALLIAHQATCERCALLALLCPDCRKAAGECVVRGQIERLPLEEVPADEH